MLSFLKEVRVEKIYRLEPALVAAEIWNNLSSLSDD